jgi:Raf kinase inhibitor-like YbhB/YbcL family protein
MFTCDGTDATPRVRWTAPPLTARSFALRMSDLDTPAPGFTHWLLYGISPEARNSFPEGNQPAPSEGRNDFGRNGYGGPCPPPGRAHRYELVVYALDRQVSDGAGLTLDQFNARVTGHVVASGRLEATYQR